MFVLQQELMQSQTRSISTNNIWIFVYLLGCRMTRMAFLTFINIDAFVFDQFVASGTYANGVVVLGLAGTFSAVDKATRI